VVREEEGRRSYSLPSASAESQCGAPLRPAPFLAPRMRTPRGPSRTLKSLHQTVSTSDVLASLPGTPESESVPPDVLSVIALLADGDAEFTCQPEDLCFAVPVRARRALAQERLPSCREPASFHPQAVCTETVWDSVFTSTGSPSAHPRPASGGATDFFLASALSISPTDLAISRWKRRAMRPTDFCHPNELRAPAPRAFPTPCATFVTGTPHGD
jgi:hypothetical protein